MKKWEDRGGAAGPLPGLLTNDGHRGPVDRLAGPRPAGKFPVPCQGFLLSAHRGESLVCQGLPQVELIPSIPYPKERR